MNTNLDVEFVGKQLRRVGAELLAAFPAQKPVIGLEPLLAAFREINGAAERSLRGGLEEKYPHVGWADDELEDAKSIDLIPTGEFWICDAIDGAVQYLRGLPNWCVSLTLIRNREPVFVAIYDPNRDELYEAQKGQGARRNGAAIHVNGQPGLQHAILAMSQPPFVSRWPALVERTGKVLAALLSEAVAVRNLGPTSLQLAQVAAGHLDAFVEVGTDDFNCIGGSLLIREAGGAATDFAGKPYSLRSESLIAGASGIQADLQKRLATH